MLGRKAMLGGLVFSLVLARHKSKTVDGVAVRTRWTREGDEA